MRPISAEHGWTGKKPCVPFTALKYCTFITGQLSSTAWNPPQAEDQGTIRSTASIGGNTQVWIERQQNAEISADLKRCWWSEEKKGDISTLTPTAKWSTWHTQCALLEFVECVSSLNNASSFSAWHLRQVWQSGFSYSKLSPATCREWQCCSSCHPSLGHLNFKETCLSLGGVQMVTQRWRN